MWQNLFFFVIKHQSKLQKLVSIKLFKGSQKFCLLNTNVNLFQFLLHFVVGDKVIAIDLYRQGICELESGISIPVSGSGEAYEKAIR